MKEEQRFKNKASLAPESSYRRTLTETFPRFSGVEFDRAGLPTSAVGGRFSSIISVSSGEETAAGGRQASDKGDDRLHYGDLQMLQMTTEVSFDRFDTQDSRPGCKLVIVSRFLPKFHGSSHDSHHHIHVCYDEPRNQPRGLDRQRSSLAKRFEIGSRG